MADLDGVAAVAQRPGRRVENPDDFQAFPGTRPGRFQGASGIDVQGDRIAVVDQIGKRLQLFRFIVPKTED